ncbi:hypothetical protein GE09DRAFT_648526 [Coniochaeta sp. 2T2.1]|nr:hypothetical protein GE09DRAFT_648526 [Coniochaeta sp. 2T2.1]
MESTSANPFGQTPDMATASWWPAMSPAPSSPSRRSSSSDSSKRSANLWTARSSKALAAHKAAGSSGPKQPASTEPVEQTPNMTTASSHMVAEHMPTVSPDPGQPASTEPVEQTPDLTTATSQMVAQHKSTVLTDTMSSASTEPVGQNPDMTATSSRLLESTDQPASSGPPAPSGPPTSLKTPISPPTFSSPGSKSPKHHASRPSRPMQLPPKPVRRAPTAFKALEMADSGRFRALLNPCAVARRWSEFRKTVLETTRSDRYSRVEKTRIMSLANQHIKMLQGSGDTDGQYRLSRVCNPNADKRGWILTDHYLRFIFTVLKDKLEDHYYGPWTLDEYVTRVRYAVFFLFELLGCLRVLWLEVRGRPSGSLKSETTTHDTITSVKSTGSHGTRHSETGDKGNGPDVTTDGNGMTEYEVTERDGAGKSWHASGKDTSVDACESNGGTSGKQADDNTHGNGVPLSYCERMEKLVPSTVLNDAAGGNDRTPGSQTAKPVDLDGMTPSNFEKMEGLGATLLAHERDGALWDRMLGCVMSRPELMRTVMPMRTWFESKFPEESQ